MNMYRLFLLLMLYSLTAVQAKDAGTAQLPREPFFTNNIIKALDGAKLGGASMGFDGPTIYDMLWFGQKINELQRGKKNQQTGDLEKKILYKGTSRTLQELILEEEKMDEHFERKRALLVSQYEQKDEAELMALEGRLVTLEHEYVTEHGPLKESLARVKKEFLDLSNGFMQQVFFLHLLVAQLTEEWCERRAKPESFLKVLSHVTTDNFKDFLEIINRRFDERMKTFRTFDIFLNELKSFLLDLVHSCPKAYKEFLDNKDKYAHKK